jgi:hypothetical protein
VTAGEGSGEWYTEQEETGPAAPEQGAEGAGTANQQTGIAALEELAARPLAEHPAAYERLHAELRSALAEIDDA